MVKYYYILNYMGGIFMKKIASLVMAFVLAVTAVGVVVAEEPKKEDNSVAEKEYLDLDLLPVDAVTDNLATKGWKWEPETNVLTLNNADLQGIDFDNAVNSDKPLIINLVEGSKNIITSNEDNNNLAYSGIYSDCDLKITGKGQLDININSYINNIYVWGNLTIEDALVNNYNSFKYNECIECININLLNCTFIVDSANDVGILCHGKIKATNCKIKIKAYKYAVLFGFIRNEVDEKSVDENAEDYFVLDEGSTFSPEVKFVKFYNPQNEYSAVIMLYKDSKCEEIKSPDLTMDMVLEDGFIIKNLEVVPIKKVEPEEKATTEEKTLAATETSIVKPASTNPKTTSSDFGGIAVIAVISLAGISTLTFVIKKKLIRF